VVAVCGELEPRARERERHALGHPAGQVGETAAGDRRGGSGHRRGGSGHRRGGGGHRRGGGGRVAPRWRSSCRSPWPVIVWQSAARSSSVVESAVRSAIAVCGELGHGRGGRRAGARARLHRRHVHREQSPGALSLLVVDDLTLAEGAKAGVRDRRVVHEDVLTIRPDDEAVAFCVVESLHGSARHVRSKRSSISGEPWAGMLLLLPRAARPLRGCCARSLWPRRDAWRRRGCASIRSPTISLHQARRVLQR